MRFSAKYVDDEQEYDADDWEDALELALAHESFYADLQSLSLVESAKD